MTAHNCMGVHKVSCDHGKPGNVMEFEWSISRPGEVMENLLKCQSHGKWKYTITKMTFLPNIKCDIPSNILMLTDGSVPVGPLHGQGWVLKDHGISLYYHGKVMEFKSAEGAQTLSSCSERRPWLRFCHIKSGKIPGLESKKEGQN